jgi:hypothetical protein
MYILDRALTLSKQDCSHSFLQHVAIVRFRLAKNLKVVSTYSK